MGGVFSKKRELQNVDKVKILFNVFIIIIVALCTINTTVPGIFFILVFVL